ncbi:hypothetical protein [Caldimonas tepidiphila]|uniref:hypothetical protein n=1 Tax=Caldimonas tepidiphila TaxID=2315841 RepID=UPI000E5BD902|nr:hypothetical protein [Caldimonas tepidiphila]
MVGTGGRHPPQRTGAHDPVRAVLRRAEELLAQGPRSVATLGLWPGDANRDSLDAPRLVGELRASVVQLLETSERLEPLMRSLHPLPFWQRWWYLLSGQTLEHKLFFREMCVQLELLAEQGQAEARRLAGQLEALERLRPPLRQELRWLERESHAARLLLSGTLAGRVAAAGFQAEDLARLGRRRGMLEARIAVLRRTRAQLLAALRQGRTTQARFHKAHARLLRLWRRRLGFELLSRRLTPRSRRRLAC